MLKEPKTQMLKELIQCAKGLIVYIHDGTFVYTCIHVHMYNSTFMCTCVYKIYLRFEHVCNVEVYHLSVLSSVVLNYYCTVPVFTTTTRTCFQ